MAKSTKGTAKKAKSKATSKKEEGLRGIVRLAGKDIPGELPLKRALLRIKGIGHSIVKPIVALLEKKVKVKGDDKVGSFDDGTIEKIDEILFNLNSEVLPAFLLNRRADPVDGSRRHVIMNDLQFAQRQDIEAKKKSRSWQGYRHSKGQKVRGQRTQNTGRRGIAVGVQKKKK